MRVNCINIKQQKVQKTDWTNANE